MLEISQLLVFHLIYFMIAREDPPFSQSINQTNGAEIQYIFVCSLVPDVFFPVFCIFLLGPYIKDLKIITYLRYGIFKELVYM